MQDNTVPIAMICDANFVMQTCVTLTSLKKNKAVSTIYEVYVIAADCGDDAINMLRKQADDNFNIYIIPASVKQYAEIKQITHISIAGLLKFDICDFLKQYDKVLYLDSDLIIREDLWELYCTDLQDNYVACVAHSLGIITGEMKMNSGMMLLNAKKIREENIKEVLFETRKALGERKSMDQETFQIVFDNKKVFLPPRYNVMMDKVNYEKKYYSMKEYNKFYGTAYQSRKELVDTAAIIHFTGAIKPWKYKFAYGFKEWFRYYQLAFGTSQELNLKGRTAFLYEQMKKDGIVSIYWLAKDKMLAFMGERFGVYLDKNHGEWN